jgi:hypothetical protein
LLDGGFGAGELRLSARSADGAAVPLPLYRPSSRVEEADFWPGPPPYDCAQTVALGRYAVEVVAERALEGPVLARFEDLEVRTAWPVDVRFLDLRGALARRRVRLVDGDGAAVTRRVRVAGGGREWPASPEAGGWLELLLPAAVAEVALEPEGFAPLAHVFARDPETRAFASGEPARGR